MCFPIITQLFQHISLMDLNTFNSPIKFHGKLFMDFINAIDLWELIIYIVFDDYILNSKQIKYI